MKRYLVLFALSFLGVGAVVAQKVEYRQSQSRIIEPKMNSYVKPLIVDLKVLEGQKRIEAGPFLFPDKDVTIMSHAELENTKTNALYMAAKQYNADIIVAATFDVRSMEKGKGLQIWVLGFPAVYDNWRTIKEEDYQWVLDAYGFEKNNSVIEKVQAISGK